LEKLAAAAMSVHAKWPEQRPAFGEKSKKFSNLLQ